MGATRSPSPRLDQRPARRAGQGRSRGAVERSESLDGREPGTRFAARRRTVVRACVSCVVSSRVTPRWRPLGGAGRPAVSRRSSPSACDAAGFRGVARAVGLRAYRPRRVVSRRGRSRVERGRIFVVARRRRRLPHGGPRAAPTGLPAAPCGFTCGAARRWARAGFWCGSVELEGVGRVTRARGRESRAPIRQGAPRVAPDGDPAWCESGLPSAPGGVISRGRMASGKRALGRGSMAAECVGWVTLSRGCVLALRFANGRPRRLSKSGPRGERSGLPSVTCGVTSRGKRHRASARVRCRWVGVGRRARPLRRTPGDTCRARRCELGRRPLNQCSARGSPASPRARTLARLPCWRGILRLTTRGSHRDVRAVDPALFEGLIDRRSTGSTKRVASHTTDGHGRANQSGKKKAGCTRRHSASAPFWAQRLGSEFAVYKDFLQTAVGERARL